MSSLSKQIIFHPLALLNISDVIQRITSHPEAVSSSQPLVGILLGISQITEEQNSLSILMSFDLNSIEPEEILEKLKLLEQIYEHTRVIGFFHVSSNPTLSTSNFQYDDNEKMVISSLTKLSTELKQAYPVFIEDELIQLIISSSLTSSDDQQFLPLKVFPLLNPSAEYTNLEVKMIQSEKVAMNSISRASQTTASTTAESGQDINLFDQSTNNIKLGLLHLEQHLDTILKYLTSIQNKEILLYDDSEDSFKKYELTKQVNLIVMKLKNIKASGKKGQQGQQMSLSLVNGSVMKETLNLMVELGASDKS